MLNSHLCAIAIVSTKMIVYQCLRQKANVQNELKLLIFYNERYLCATRALHFAVPRRYGSLLQ